MLKSKVLAAAAIAALGLSLTGGLTSRAAAEDALRVVATIKPIHSLAAAVMEGHGQPKLLIKGATSEHAYALRPSDARVLNDADIIIRVSANLETFLERPIASLSGKARIVTLEDVPGLKLLPVRQGGPFEPHSHEDHGDAKGHDHAEADHDDEGNDAHLWLSPSNAALIADHLASVFGEARPGQAADFKANASKLKDRLAALEAGLRPRLTALKDKDFIVFHDAYQYFEDHFGLKAAGSITVSPQRQPGAARLKEIRTRIASSKSVCVFSEPQFEPKLVKTVIEGTNARTGVLDPLGADLAEGPDQYFKLLDNLAADLERCLS
jgi:zinc transport system substrate-binding protein